MYNVYFSNQTECLYQRLKGSLFHNSKPFAKRLVIVPSPAMKSWLMLQLAKDPEIGIAAGLEITYLDQAFQRLNALLLPTGESKKTLTELELALIIENEIRQLLHASDKQLWRPLLHYLGNPQGTSLSRKNERRLTALSCSLATLFGKYGLHGKQMISAWESTAAQHWQQALWQRIFLASEKQLPFQQMQDSLAHPIFRNHSEIQVHLFAVSYLPKLQHELLQHYASGVKLNYYVLSPCQAFWSDLLSDRAGYRLQKNWKERGATEAQQYQLEEYLRDRNPLLANFGRMGREMAEQIEESGALTSEDYVLPAIIQETPQYAELWSEEVYLQNTQQPLTLLQGIQADMVLLRTPQEQDKIICSPDDRSIQFHVSSSPLREMQNLYNSLLQIIQKHTQDEQPMNQGDIVVMLPDINAYVPSIKAVFESPESVLNVQIMDLNIPANNPLIQGFLHLLSLPLSRWDAASIMQLFEFPHFQKKQSLKPEEVRQIREWIQEAEVRWGEDAIHRNELLHRDHHTHKMSDETPVGTWEYALGRLLAGLAITVDDENTFDITTIPLEVVDSIQGELLGRWILLMRSLKKDLDVLQANIKLPLAQWTGYLKCLCESYFENVENEELENTINVLHGQIALFHQMATSVTEAVFPFSTIKHHLEANLNQQTSNYRDTALNAVRFCALLPMRAIPARVIVLSGMNHGEFPRQESISSLNMLHSHPECDYNPSRTDYDRFLLLEALLSSRDYFLMTYQGYSLDDGKEAPPSLVVTELLNYLEKSFEGPIREQCVFYHPYHSFDQKYFTPNTLIPNFIPSDFAAAKAFYLSEKTASQAFIPEFSLIAPEAPQKTIIDLKELLAFARNPLRTYFKSLGIFLPDTEERKIYTEENFHISALQAHNLKKDSLKSSANMILKKAQKNGKLPIGPFKKAVVEEIQQTIQQQKLNLAQLGINLEDIFSIEIAEQFNVPKFDNTWELPPLVVPYHDTEVVIVGSIPYACSQGLLVDIKDTRTDILKMWPQFLIFCCLIQQYKLPCKAQAIFTREDKGVLKSAYFDDSFSLLTHYLDYYFAAKKTASPIMPELADILVHTNAENAKSAFKKLLKNHSKPIYNKYLKWTLQEQEFSKPESLVEEWRTPAQKLFGKLFENWYPTQNKEIQMVEE